MDEQWILEMREKMADYKWSAPELSWDELDQALAAGVPPKAHQLWMRRLAAAAVILLIAGVGYWRILQNETEPLIEKHWAQEQPLEDQKDTSHDSGLNQEPAPVILAKSAQMFNKADVSIPESETESKSESETFTFVSEEGPDTVNTAEPTEKGQPQAVEQKTKATNEIFPVVYPSELHQRQHLDNRLTAKVYMSSAMTGSQTESYGMGAYLASSSELSGDPNFANLTAHTEQRVHHRQPVRFGLSLRYRLTDRWSVENGLSYTRLSSDITTIIDDKTTVTEQRLNYIGLPLNISYELWRSRYFGLYVSGGSTIEKQLEASPWQFSLNGAAGAEYKLTDFFSLYAEPGIGYYFKDGSSTPTIYKDHPLNFNLSFGLRLHLK